MRSQVSYSYDHESDSSRSKILFDSNCAWVILLFFKSFMSPPSVQKAYFCFHLIRNDQKLCKNGHLSFLFSLQNAITSKFVGKCNFFHFRNWGTDWKSFCVHRNCNFQLFRRSKKFYKATALTLSNQMNTIPTPSITTATIQDFFAIKRHVEE